MQRGSKIPNLNLKMKKKMHFMILGRTLFCLKIVMNNIVEISVYFVGGCLYKGSCGGERFCNEEFK